MKALSLKLDENILADTNAIVKNMAISRNAYINDALALYNKVQHRKNLRQQLIQESRATYGSSIEVLSEFDAMDAYEIDHSEEI